MHPRSCFATPPDLKLLAQAFPDLRPFLIDGSYLDYNDPNALRAVTRCYFKHFFGLTVAIPVDRLCPTLGNRLNYVLWLEDLVSETRLDDKPVVGLDVGTGATAVYPLLTIAQNKQWRMLATESDQRSFEAARDNLKQNSLSERIILLKADVDAPILLQHNAVISQPLNFVMCNPPFYTDEEEIATSAKLKGGAKSAAFIGSPSEMITPGGEVAFTLRLFEESKALQKRIQWYTTMLGKLSSVEQLVGHLRSAGINNYVLHELTQGKTRRWVVGWSFAPQRAMPETAASQALALRSLTPRSLVCSFKAQYPLKALQGFCSTFAIEWCWQEMPTSMLLTIKLVSWSREARRRRAVRASEGVPTIVLAQVNSTGLELILRSAENFLVFESLCSKLKQSLKVYDVSRPHVARDA